MSKGVEWDVITTIDVFHEKSHEGDVFIHNSRHNTIADSGTLEHLLVLPANEPNRQVHLKYAINGKANTGTLDANIDVYKDTTVSANGTPETINSTNDAIPKNTDVLLFVSPTITGDGTLKTSNALLGDKKSASNTDQGIDELIFAPDGNNLRNYLIRLTNNSGGTVDVTVGLFFLDTHAKKAPRG